MGKVIFVGMCNPQSNAPLSLEPRGGAGWWLHDLAQRGRGASIPDVTWRHVFEFRNVLPGPTWTMGAAKEAAPAVLEALRGRRAVLLGGSVARALGLPSMAPCMFDLMLLNVSTGYGEITQENSISYSLIPHPSGLNRWYNDSDNRMLVAAFLARLYSEAVQELGT